MGGSRSQQRTEKHETTQVTTNTSVGDIGFTGAQGVEAVREVVDLAKVGVRESSALGTSLIEHSAKAAASQAPVVVVGSPGGRDGGTVEETKKSMDNLPLIVAGAAAVAAFVSLNR